MTHPGKVSESRGEARGGEGRGGGLVSRGSWLRLEPGLGSAPGSHCWPVQGLRGPAEAWGARGPGEEQRQEPPHCLRFCFATEL